MGLIIRPWQLLAAISLFAIVYYADGQGLNDPITQYIEGRLGNRRIWWCPSGYGYLSYCPQPTDWDNYNWCCTYPYMGSWQPSCCPFALPTGAVVAIVIASIVFIAGGGDYLNSNISKGCERIRQSWTGTTTSAHLSPSSSSSSELGSNKLYTGCRRPLPIQKLLPMATNGTRLPMSSTGYSGRCPIQQRRIPIIID